MPDKIKKTVLTKKTVLIQYYSSGQIGSTITNAITGYKERGNIVGSNKEDLYFKVSISNGENGNQPATLFYNSPEDYEKHQYILLSDLIKKKWNEKYTKAILRLNVKKE